jgi:N-acetylglutamate synthase
VGRRVVLRHRLPDGRATDVLGELVSWDDVGGYARVATPRGEVDVALEDILMGKPVPPAPAPRSRRAPRPLPPPLSIIELHDVMADGWRPLEQAQYGLWRLRAAQGFTGRANSVLPLGDPPAPLPEAVDHVESWYAEHSLPGRFCVMWPLGSGPDEPAYGADPLEAELVRRGYRLDYPSLVLTRPLPGSPKAGLLPDSRSGVPHRSEKPAFGEHSWTVEVNEEPDEGFLALYRYRGEDLPPVAAKVLMSAPAQAFASVRVSGSAPGGERTVAIGRVASARGWSGVTAVEVAEDHRRQGLAQVVMAVLHDWARARGDHSAYLQVARANVPARALYERLGYTAHSGYHYRISRPSPAP